MSQMKFHMTSGDSFIKDHQGREKPEAILIGENWHDAYPYLMGDQYDGIMNYAFTKGLSGFLPLVA